MISLSVDELFKNHAEGLGLSWLAGREGGLRAIWLEADLKLANVGYLNQIHPHQIQIISHYEFAYLEHHTRNRLNKNYFKQLFKNENLVCIIVVDNLQVPADLLSAANDDQIPIFASQLSGENIINYLHTTLAKLLAPRTTKHGVFMDVLGMGVLIRGESGTGKSELALELVSRGHRLIADDCPEFSRIAPDTISGACSLKDANPFLEVRGLGILNVQKIYGESAIKHDKYLRLVVHLVHMTSESLLSIDPLQGDYHVYSILGVDIPEIRLQVAPGRNLAVLLECAICNQILKLEDYNAADELYELQWNAMCKNNKI